MNNINNLNRTSAIGRETERMFIYFSHLMDRVVVDKNDSAVGRIYDIVVKPADIYPHSAFLIIRRGFLNRKYALIKWQDIAQIDSGNKETRLAIEKSQVVFKESHDNKEELTLRRDILDQQVVDTYNHKVIRVNDIHLLFVEHFLMVAHVDISTRGLLRRLGFEEFVDFFVRIFNKNSKYLTAEYLISWKYIQPLSINPVSMAIKVDVPHKHFANIPAADLGEIFLDLNINQQISLFKSLDVATRSRIFIHIDFKTQKLLLEVLRSEEIAEILQNIPSDEATDFLEKIPKERINHILSFMETKHSKKLSQLLGYSSDSAGGLMTAEYIAFTKETPVEAVLKQIKERSFKVEPPQFVYVVDDGNHLVGSTNFRRLMLAEPQEPVEKAIFPKVYSVHLDSGVKEVAYLMEKYKYYAIPVIDENNVLHGIITVDDVLSQVIAIAWRRLKKIKPRL